MKNNSGILVEACAANYRMAKLAESSGADIIEVCENLAEGGTTPSIGTIKRLVEEISVSLFVLIRPRGGDFVYSSGEFEIMKADILACKEAGAAGVSIGLLTANGKIDAERTAELVELARPMQVSFNKAFDQVSDFNEALETLCSLKADRLLTSGGFGCASDNLGIIRELVKNAGERIGIVICGGLNNKNFEYIARQAGVSAVHGAGIL